MEKQFLPFNDYLGLSSIFTQAKKNDPLPATEEEVEKVTKSVSDAWIDKRIEEILHQYSLKRSLQSSGINQFRQAQPPNLSNQVSSNVFNLNSTCPENLGMSCLLSDNADLFSFNNGSYRGSLTNSPLTPNSASWLTSAVATTTVSKSAQSFNSGNDSTSLTNLDHQSYDRSQCGSNFSFSISTEMQPFTLVAGNQKMNRRNNLGCSFCRNNKEVDDWVMSHQLKDSLNRVMCPILRSYVCPLCFASGDNAHTLGHCPLNPDKKNSSLPLAVRRRTNATGKVKM